VKKILAALLLAALLLDMFSGCYFCGREIPPSELGEKAFLGQLDRFEVDGNGAEWAVISIDAPPYSVSGSANEEINSETTKPGAWITFSLDGDYAYNIRLAVIV